jgi:hypothetical protein
MLCRWKRFDFERCITAGNRFALLMLPTMGFASIGLKKNAPFRAFKERKIEILSQYFELKYLS